MASDDNLLAWGGLLVAGLGTVFLGIQALKTIAVTKELDLVACPNCGQPFDDNLVQGFSPGKYSRVRLDRLRTFPRCWYTWIP